MAITARERSALDAALKAMVNELFKRQGHPEQIDLARFHSQFEDTQLPRILRVVERLVQQHTFGRYTVETVDRSRISGDVFKCKVFLHFVKLADGGVERPRRQYFAFGPRRGVTVCN